MFFRWGCVSSPLLPPLSFPHSPWMTLASNIKPWKLGGQTYDFIALSFSQLSSGFSILPTLLAKPSWSATMRHPSSAWQSNLISQSPPVWGSSVVGCKLSGHCSPPSALSLLNQVLSVLHTITMLTGFSLRHAQTDLIWQELILNSGGGLSDSTVADIVNKCNCLHPWRSLQRPLIQCFRIRMQNTGQKQGARGREKPTTQRTTLSHNNVAAA